MGGGGGSSSTHQAVGPKSDQLLNLENQFYGISDQMMQMYMGGGYNPAFASIQPPPTPQTKQLTPADMFGNNMVSAGKDDTPAPAPQQPQVPVMDPNSPMAQMMNTAMGQHNAANDRYSSLMGDAAGYTDQIKKMLAQAQTVGDPWYGKAWDSFGQAENLLGQMSSTIDYTNNINKWYDEAAQQALTGSLGMLNTGEIPKPIMDAMMATMQQGVDKSMGANLNNLASRGILNSSVTNKGIADLGRSAADSMNANYLNAFNSVLGGHNQTASTAANAGRTLADTFLNINSNYDTAMRNALGLGDSYAKTGSMRTGDMLNVAGGYGNALAGNVAERGALMQDIPQYYYNAMAPVMPSYDLLKTMQQDHWNSNKQDTVVKQGK